MRISDWSSDVCSSDLSRLLSYRLTQLLRGAEGTGIMPMTERILLATDFSTRSDRALRRATMTAKTLGASVSLVHVVDSDQPRYMIDAQVDASRLILNDTARTIGEFDDVADSSNVVEIGRAQRRT